MTLDEATTRLLADLARAGSKPIWEMTVEEARSLSGRFSDRSGRGPEMAALRTTRVQVPGGHVGVRLLAPNDQPGGLIVYHHGGGWVIGAIADFETLGRTLAARTGCAVLLVDYRMAPEYRFPTAVEDAWAALRWADAHLEELAGARVPLIVAGDGAGGNVSAVMTQRAKAAGGPAIALQILVYPVTDCDCDTTSYTDRDNQLMLSRDSMTWFWAHYAPVEAARAHPDASPLRQPDLTSLPPAVILTAEHDVLRDEGELYATRLMKAGVPVQHRRFTGQMHGFFTMINILPGSEAGLDFVADAVAQVTSAPTART
jgi:acetyl esterase